MKKLSVLTIMILLAGGLFASGSAEKMDSDKNSDMKGMKTSIYTGYLMDVACGTGGKGMDGSDVVKAPQDHTKMCLVACAQSGFGISVKDGSVYKFIAFADSASNKKAQEFLDKVTKEKDIEIIVEGFMVKDKLCVVSIKAKA